MKKLLLAAVALAWCAVPAFGADVPDLIKKLKSSDSDVRRAAAKDLADAGTDAKPAVPALRGALKDSDRFVRRFAAQALAAIGPEASAAVPELRIAANAKEIQVAEAATVALGKIGPPALPALMAIAKDKNKEPVVRRKAIEGLGSMGEAGRSAIPTLTEIIKPGKGKMKGGRKGDPTDVRADVANALGNLARADDTEAVEALEALAGIKIRDKVLAGSVRQALNKIKRRKS